MSAHLLAIDLCEFVDDMAAERIMVNLIPTPQWLTAETLANLRTAAAGDGDTP